MSKELCYVIDQISREKGIPRDVLIETLRSALLSAARKKFGGGPNIDLTIDPKTCNISAFETKKIVSKVSNMDEEISIEEAIKIYPDAKEGDTVNMPLDLHDFSRIAAQTAKQVIFQRVREAERDVIYNEFKDKIGQVVSGTIMRKEKGIYFLNIGKTEAVLPFKETLPNENLKRGDTIRAYIEDVRITSKGPVIMVTRTSPQFVGALFKMEVPEINEGLVIIKDVVREPGERTKLTVYSKNPSIDPVGACVGMKGTRVQSIVRELRGERIDIIPWTDDPRELVARALSPAVVDRIGINEETKTAMVVVGDQQLSLAIGKRGQNVRLAMKLTGWDIDILSESEYSKIRLEEANRTFSPPSDG
ncbi:MAG: transcription termination/antitermination protein NusA [Nitrospirae bacterium]|nr:transcription termination/antitermination protein NusA [Nitrospirota bacterium]